MNTADSALNEQQSEEVESMASTASEAEEQDQDSENEEEQQEEEISTEQVPFAEYIPYEELQLEHATAEVRQLFQNISQSHPSRYPIV